MKKLTFEQVKSYIESFNYQLLSTEYINSRSNITVKCSNGHIYETTYGKFKCGYRCIKCANNKKRNSIEKVEKILKSNGFELLSNNYKTATTKITVKCSNGHIYDTTFQNIRNGNKCPYCNNSRIYKQDYIDDCDKINYKFLKLFKRKQNWYISFVCEQGHRDILGLHYWNKGVRCRYCSGNKIYWEDILWDLYNNGWLLLNRKNRHKITSKTTLKLKCRKCGSIWNTNYLKFRKLSKECIYCRRKERIDNYNREFELEGYKLLNHEVEDIEKNKPIFYICSNGHFSSMYFVNWDLEQRCGECWKEELEKRTKKNRRLMRGKKLYDNLVDYYTKLSLKEHWEQINPNNMELNWENTIDHKYSKKQGYLDGILPQIIGSYINLEIMSRNENSSKNGSCSISMKSLFEKYEMIT